MLPLSEYATVSGEQTLREAIIALDKAQLGLTNDRHHHRAILVSDARGEIIGKLSHFAMLQSLEPRLLTADDHSILSRAGLDPEFIGKFEDSVAGFEGGLDALCRNAAETKAKDAMVPVGESLDEDEPLIVAIHKLIASRAQSMLVVKNGKTTGILRLSDVFEEVADVIRDLVEK
jgi:hypothetical protein